MKTLMETLDKFLCKRLLIVLMMPTEILMALGNLMIWI